MSSRSAEEVIKALTICTSSRIPPCHECPYRDESWRCEGAIKRDALKLIQKLMKEEK